MQSLSRYVLGSRDWWLSSDVDGCSYVCVQVDVQRIRTWSTSTLLYDFYIRNRLRHLVTWLRGQLTRQTSLISGVVEVNSCCGDFARGCTCVTSLDRSDHSSLCKSFLLCLFLATKISNVVRSAGILVFTLYMRGSDHGNCLFVRPWTLKGIYVQYYSTITHIRYVPNLEKRSSLQQCSRIRILCFFSDFKKHDFLCFFLKWRFTKT